MAIIRKKELSGMSVADITKKLDELSKAVLELRGEGRKDKVKSLRKAIARLKTAETLVSSAKAQKPASPEPARSPVKKA